MKLVGLTKEQLQDKEQFYQCGSRKLCHWLMTSKQTFPVYSYVHTNGKTISVFVMNNELSEYLHEWSNAKNTKFVK